MKKILVTIMCLIMSLSAFSTGVLAEDSADITQPTIVNFNSSENGQIIPFPISENYGYWKLTVNNTTVNLMEIRIYKENTEDESVLNDSVFYGKIYPKEQETFYCEKDKPFESGNYYIAVNKGGTDELSGYLSYQCAASYDEIVKETTFNDISGHWAEGTINKWKDKGIISGYLDGTFKPDNSVTRAELAKILALAFDLQEKTAINYDDVKAENWYYSYLESSAKYIPIYPLPISYETNIPYVEVSDKGLNSFLPETPAMRMHVAEAVVEIKKDKEKINIELPSIQDIQADVTAAFKDDDYENLYAMHGTIPENVKRMLEYTYLANKLGIMQGDADGYFHPYDSVTRAELVTLLDRVISTTD